VLPLKYSGADADLTALAEGLTEDIVAGMSRFSYLRVIARSATSRYANQAVEVSSAAKDLGARYVMEGTVRQAGSKVRIAAQLVDATTGAHLWAETYVRTFSPEALFDLQDELVPRIVSTVADSRGVLAQTMGESLRNRTPDQLTPYEAVLRSFAYLQRINAEEHALARSALERAVEKAPGQADAWAMLSIMYREEYSQGFNLLPDPLGRASATARRAIEVGPSNHYAHHALASVLFFQRELQAFRNAAERAVALNPMDGFNLAYMGNYMVNGGEWERGCAWTEKARNLNPNFPGWYWFAPSHRAYHEEDYRTALEFALKVNMPSLWRSHLLLAAIYGQLGEVEAAQRAARDLLTMRPDFAGAERIELGKFWQPEFAEHVIEGLRKAGMNIAGEARLGPAKSSAKSGANPGLAAPSIAVLPFANLSAEKDQEYFSDGLAEEIINLLARIPGLRVIARTSAFAFRGKEEDIRGIAEALGVGTILQGSVRRAGSRIRVTAQLIKADDRALIWSQRYDRELTDIFAVQDEISAAIAEQLKVSLTPSPAMGKHTTNVAAYEALLEARHHLYKFSPDSMARALRCLENALSIDPNYAAALTSLAMYYGRLAEMGAANATETLPKARAAAQKALSLDDGLAGAHAALGFVSAVGDYNWAEAANHFRRALELDSVSPEVIAPYAVYYLKPQGRLEEGLDELKRWLQRDPLSIIARNDAAMYLLIMRRYEDCIAMAEETLSLEPNDAFSMFCIVESKMGLQRYEEAIALAEKCCEIHQRWIVPLAYLGISYARDGRAEDARRVVAEMHELSEKSGYLHANAVAAVHVALGEMEIAADLLDQAIDQRELMITNLKGWSLYDDFRSHPRYPALLTKMNLA
jgi:serine/threonine-protein kinase